MLNVNGTRPDSDGYTVVVTPPNQSDPATARVEPAGGVARFSDLPAGTHSIVIDDLAAHCSVIGPNLRSFTVVADTTSTVRYRLACPGPGTFLVKVSSTGVDLDPDGYFIAFAASSVREVPVGVNETIRISEEDLPSGGPWTVTLNGVSGNCLARGGVTDLSVIASFEPLRVRLPGDKTVQITFSVACFPPSSRLAFEVFDGPEADIFLGKNAGGSEVVNLTSHPSQDLSPALSPDRTRVLFSSNRDDPAGGLFDLYVVNVNGGGLTRLSRNAWVGPQAWSPDGTRIVFISTRDDPNGEIYIMNADGSGLVRLTRDDAFDVSPAWSPDGASIAFCSDPDSDSVFEIYRMSAVDGSAVVKVADDGCDPAWSPDGSKIAYYTGTIPWEVIPDLAVVGADGTGFVQLHASILSSSDSSWKPSWSPDGSAIAFTQGGNQGLHVKIVPFDGRGFGEILEFRDGASPSWR